MNPPLCKHCGQPVHGVATNTPSAKHYHGACYNLEHPPEHPAGPLHTMSYEERVEEGLEQP